MSGLSFLLLGSRFSLLSLSDVILSVSFAFSAASFSACALSIVGVMTVSPITLNPSSSDESVSSLSPSMRSSTFWPVIPLIVAESVKTSI